MTDTPKSADCVSVPRRFRHKKRGTTYTVIGDAQVQCPPDAPLTEYEIVTVYRSDVGPLDDEHGLWVRRKSEFEDGRFEELASAPAAQGGEDGPRPTELDKLLAIENSQDRFEAWMASGNYPEIADVALERLPDGQYKSQLTFAAWQAWQAVERMHQTIVTDDYAQLARQLRDIAKNCNLNHIRGDGRIVIERAATLLAPTPQPVIDGGAVERALGAWYPGEWPDADCFTRGGCALKFAADCRAEMHAALVAAFPQLKE